MLLQYLWAGMILSSLIWGVLTGKGNLILPAGLEAAGRAIALSLEMAGGYLFFCGLMNIVKKLKIHQLLSDLLRPVLFRMLGTLPQETAGAVAMNLSANLLGLGNAATPYGIRAAELLDAHGSRHALYLLLIINATSIQLLPTTVLTLRNAAGSANANAILLPSLAATCASTLTGVGLGLLCRRFSKEGRHA